MGKILLIGGNSALAQVLKPKLASNYEVITAGKRNCDIDLDVTWPIEKFLFPNEICAVINLAAQFGGDGFYDLLSAEEVNAIGSLKIARTCEIQKISNYVQISSINACLKKDSNYYGPYSLSKKHADDLVEFFCNKKGINFAILRPSQLYGECKDLNRHQPFLYNAIEKALRGIDVSIYGTRSAMRNYLNIDDFCNVIYKVVEKKICGTFSCTSSRNIGLEDLANLIINCAGTASKVLFDKSMPDIADNVFDYDDSLYKIIEYSPSTSMENGLKSLVAYMRNLI